MSTHENYQRAAGPKASSNRTFGLVFMAFFAILAVWPLLRGGELRLWALPVSGVFLLAALALPQTLAPLNQAWTALGGLLHKITNPIILGILFYGVFAPFGWLLRLLGKDFLRLRPEPEADSYWVKRDPPGPLPESVTHQF